MIGLRDKFWRRLGAALAGMALSIQLAVLASGILSLAAALQPADAFGAHALCLAGEPGAAQPPRPADRIPAVPAHEHAALCCLAHALPGIQPVAAAPPQPVAFFSIARGPVVVASFTPGPRRGPANARAPPTLA